MNRMREHVMNEIDKDGDKLISLEEFMRSAEGEEFNKDEEWKVISWCSIGPCGETMH